MADFFPDPGRPLNDEEQREYNSVMGWSRVWDLKLAAFELSELVDDLATKPSFDYLANDPKIARWQLETRIVVERGKRRRLMRLLAG